MLIMCFVNACGSGGGSISEEKPHAPESAPPETEGSTIPIDEVEIGEDGAMICDIGSWQAHQNEIFAEAYERINGGEVADQLTFEFDSESGTVEDKDLIFGTFIMLSNLNVYTNHGYYSPETDFTDQFTFFWEDGFSYTFHFTDTGVFQTDDFDCFDTFAFVGDYDYEEICSNFLFQYEGLQSRGPGPQGEPKQEEPVTQLEEDLDFDDGFFEWDADGDGNAEKFSVDFYRNGDEAQDVLVLTVVSGSELNGEGVTIVGAYSIDALTSETDEEGPSLIISYSAGDYYSHDFPAKSRIRLRNGTFEVEDLD